MNMTFIYALIDPNTKQVRYIGKANDPIARLEEGHMKEGYKRDKDGKKIPNHKISWLNSLKRKKVKPILEILDKVLESEWQFWEKHYISLYRSWGFNLINYTNGGEGFSDPTGDIAKRISKTLTGRKQAQITIDKRIDSKRRYKEKTGNWAKPGTYDKARATRIANDSYKGCWTKELRSEQSIRIKKQYKSGERQLSGGVGISRPGKLNAAARSVVQYDLKGQFIAEYDTTKEAYNKVHNTNEKVCGANITINCKGKGLSAYNYIWRYKTPKQGELENTIESVLASIKIIKEKKDFVKENMKKKQQLRWL